MNLLYIAYSCSPWRGSEDKVGWNIPLEASKCNNVWVITKEEAREPISKYLAKYHLNNIAFYYVDIPKIYKLFFKGFLYSGRLNIWHKRALAMAEKICIEEKIDIIHQITPNEFRAIGSYGKIRNVPFVCGPLGGAEKIPDGLKSYARNHKIVEFIRNIANQFYKYKLKKHNKLKQCDYLIFTNEDTYNFLGRGERESLIVDVGLSYKELK